MLDLVNVNYDTLIPNNVDLSTDKRVLKALEKWHPGYINWWKGSGRKAFRNRLSICAPRSGSIRKAGPSSTT